MKIHEYQAKAILAQYNVPVPRGEVAYTAEEAEAAAKHIGGSVVVKAQIHAGGRGKGGGVKVAKNSTEAAEFARQMIGMRLVTRQTGPEGRTVHRLLVEETLPIERELYLGIVLDRVQGEAGVHGFGGGRHGDRRGGRQDAGADSEGDLAAGLGLAPYQARKLAFGIGIPAASANAAAAAMVALAKAYLAMDASLAEINPFILTKDGKVYALDAKINFDDNALYRHKELLDLRDLNEEDPLEVEASRFGLNYIKLEGTVGCMVNGAGPGDVHHGHHQARRRRAGELSRRGRRRQRRAGQERVPHPADGQEREGRADQYFRRHPALRHAGHGGGGGGARSPHRGAHRGAHGRHQRGDGPADPAWNRG